MPNQRPNVLLWITHDTGRFVSPYGYPTVATPHAERLAAEGTLLADAFCCSPLCSPSRAAIVTGRQPHQTGVHGLVGRPMVGGFDLHPEVPHAAAIYAGAGYESVLCGFMHEARELERVGFHRGVGGSGRGNNWGGDIRDYPAALTDWWRDRDPARPFYLQLGSHETHREWLHQDVRPDASRGLWRPPYLRELPEIDVEIAELQGAVARFDDGLGGVLDWLDSTGQADQTIVVITTDHGLDLPRAKGTFGDPGLEVMLLLRGPGVPSGVTRRGLFSQVDLLPSLLAACGIDRPAGLAGQSGWEFITAGGAGAEAVFAGKTYHDTYDPTRAVRTERYKYIRYFEVGIFQDLRLATLPRLHWFARPELARRDSVEELYDLAADPLEMVNLAADPAHQGTRDELRRRLRNWMRSTDDPLLGGPVASRSFAAELEAFTAD